MAQQVANEVTDLSAGAAKYVVTFERIGRKHNVAPLEIEVPVPHRAIDRIADYIAEKVLRYARKHLGSKWYEVTVDLEPDMLTGKVAIEFERFGKGTIAAVTE